jgi:hypothetical protein
MSHEAPSENDFAPADSSQRAAAAPSTPAQADDDIPF